MTDPATITAVAATLTDDQRRVLRLAAPNGLESVPFADQFGTVTPHARTTFDSSVVYSLCVAGAERPALLILRRNRASHISWADLTDVGREVAAVLERERWEGAAAP